MIALGNEVYDITDEGEGYLDEGYDAENDVWMRTDDENGAPTAGEEPDEI